MPVIIFSGVDGSGKSSVIRELEQRLEREGVGFRTVWLRYSQYSAKIVFLLAKVMGLYSYEYENGTRVLSYHDFYRSRLISQLLVLTTLVDSALAAIIKVYIPVFFSRKTIICDRWVPDILVDLATDIGEVSIFKAWYARLFWSLMPRNRLVFVVTRDEESTRQCRKENILSKNFSVRYAHYSKLSERDDVIQLQNITSVSTLATRAYDVVNAEIL